jgi:hypothetical protein
VVVALAGTGTAIALPPTLLQPQAEKEKRFLDTSGDMAGRQPSMAVAVRAVLATEAQLPQPLEPLALLGLEAVVALPQTRALRGR